MKLAMILLAAGLWGQDTLTVSTPAPPAIAFAGAAAQGPARGSAPIWYWVVVRYPIGTAQPSTPALVPDTVGAPNLSGTNFVRISWLPMQGATGYDVLRSTTPTFPGPCAACAVVLNTSSLTVDDTGGALSAYPPNGVLAAPPASAEITLNNRDEAAPYMNVRILGGNFRLGLISAWSEGNCVQYLAGGKLGDSGFPCGSGGGGGGNVFGGPSLTTAGACVYVSAAGTLAQATSPGCRWDAVNARLGLGTASPAATLEVNSSSGSPTSANVRFLNTYANTFIPLGEFLAPNQAPGQDAYFSIGRNAGNGNRVGISFVYSGDASPSNRMSLGNFYNGVSGPIHILYSGSTGIGPSNTSPTGTLHVRNAAAGGATTVTFQAGDTQGSTQLQQWAINNGTVFAYVDALNQSLNSGQFRIGNASGGFWSQTGLVYPSNASILWSTTTNAATGVYGTGLVRSADGVIKTTNGNSTDYFLFDGPNLRLGLGGFTSSFPMLARNGTIVETKLGDNSAYAQHRASGFLVPGGSNAICADGTTGTCGISGGSGAASAHTDFALTRNSGTSATLAAGRYQHGNGTLWNLASVGLAITTLTASGCTGTPITCTVSSMAGTSIANGHQLTVSGVVGNTNANGTFIVERTNDTTLVLLGSTSNGTQTGTGTVAGAGNGTCVVYGAASGYATLDCPASAALITTCTGACVMNQSPTASAVPPDGTPFGELTVVAGAWSASADSRGWLNTGYDVQGGQGIVVNTAGGTQTVGVDGTVMRVGAANNVVGSINSTAATRTAPHRSSTGSPVGRDNCTLGDSYFQTDATPGQNTWACTATGTPGTWSLQGSSGGSAKWIQSFPTMTCNQGITSPSNFLGGGYKSTGAGHAGYCGSNDQGSLSLGATEGPWILSAGSLPSTWSAGAGSVKVTLTLLNLDGSGTHAVDVALGCTANNTAASATFGSATTLTISASSSSRLYVGSVTPAVGTCAAGSQLKVKLTHNGSSTIGNNLVSTTIEVSGV